MGKLTAIWAMRNTGHSGGWWFEQIINAQPGLKAYAEPLNPRHGEEVVTTSGKRSILQFLKDELGLGRWRSLGVIKPADGTVLAFCEEHGKVVQVVRHPISIIGWKQSSYWYKVQSGTLPIHLFNHMHVMEAVLGRKIETREDHFDAYTLNFAWNVYRPMLRDRAGWPITRLEDVNYSLATDRLFFRRFMENMTQVEWLDEVVINIRDQMPANKDDEEPETALEWDSYRLEHGWSYDPSPLRVWASWSERRRMVFVDAFADILLQLGYGWPEVQP